jgi:hypothetical protein
MPAKPEKPWPTASHVHRLPEPKSELARLTGIIGEWVFLPDLPAAVAPALGLIPAVVPEAFSFDDGASGKKSPFQRKQKTTTFHSNEITSTLPALRIVVEDCSVYGRGDRAGQRVTSSIVRLITRDLKLEVNEAKSAVARLRQRKILGFSFTVSG